ncbi:MAG: nucleotidyl transferase AbiEii/AbiGii toxin family protein, partial [Vicinamibacteria bacterium]
MIEDKFVDLYARNSGLRDKLVAERDVVLTYALRALLDAGVMSDLAFKGGTCLRKLIFGSAGRFSEDLDFTLDTDRPDDDVLTEIVDVLNREQYGITFTFNEYYKT